MSFLYKPFAFLLIFLAGWLLTHFGLFRPGDHRLVSKIVMNLTLPCAVLEAFGTQPHDISLLPVVGLAFLCAFIPMPLLCLLTRRCEKKRRVFFMLNASGYNIGCFSLPLVQSFFGAAGAVVVCMFDIGNAIMVTGGSYAITSSLLHTDGEVERETPGKVLKKFLSSVAFDTYMIMLVLMVFNIPIPQPLLALAEPLGAANGFLSMLMLGVMFQIQTDRRYLADTARMLLFRLGFAALAALFLYFCTPFALPVRQVLAVASFAPMSVLATVYTEKCRGDGALSSFANSLSVLLGLVVMTLLSVLMLHT